jgi:hypothetical protein
MAGYLLFLYVAPPPSLFNFLLYDASSYSLLFACHPRRHSASATHQTCTYTKRAHTPRAHTPRAHKLLGPVLRV